MGNMFPAAGRVEPKTGEGFGAQAQLDAPPRPVAIQLPQSWPTANHAAELAHAPLGTGAPAGELFPGAAMAVKPGQGVQVHGDGQGDA